MNTTKYSDAIKVQMLKAQNAELLAALKSLCDEIAKESGDLDQPFKAACAVIAKVKHNPI